MSTASSTDALIKKYQLSALPENVLRLSKLIQGAFETNAGEIATIIKADQNIADRVIKIATRGRDIDMDVESAVVRIGIHQITLVVLTELVMHAVGKTFATMLKTQIDTQTVTPSSGDQVVGCIHFKGTATGRVFLRIPTKAADWIVTKFLGKDLPATPAELLPDVTGELLNIIGGNFKSNLVDAGLPCTLSVPQVETRIGFSADNGDGEHHLSIPFTAQGMGVFLDLITSSVTKSS